MNECDLSKCKHIADLEHELSEANAALACCKVWADDARKQRDDAMEAGLDMLDVLTVKAAGGVYSPSEETVQRWRNACTANTTDDRTGARMTTPDSTTSPARAPGTVPAMVVPDGFRLLDPGERIRKGDIYCRGAGHSWHECLMIGGKWSADGFWPIARRHNT